MPGSTAKCQNNFSIHGQKRLQPGQRIGPPIRQVERDEGFRMALQHGRYDLIRWPVPVFKGLDIDDDLFAHLDPSFDCG